MPKPNHSRYYSVSVVGIEADEQRYHDRSLLAVRCSDGALGGAANDESIIEHYVREQYPSATEYLPVELISKRDIKFIERKLAASDREKRITDFGSKIGSIVDYIIDHEVSN